VLGRVNGELADRLGGGLRGEATLQDLEDANAFVTSLDAGRSWFRYHQLLGELLRLQLRRETPDEVGALHRSAARWLAERGSVVEGIGHAQAGLDWRYACDLLMDRCFSLVLDGRQETLHALLDRFPPALAHTTPELAVLLAADRLARGAPAEPGAVLTRARAQAGRVPAHGRARFDLTLAVVELMRARAGGDLAGAAARAQACLDLPDGGGGGGRHAAPSEDLRAVALMNLGIVELWAVRLDDSERHLEGAIALARTIGRAQLVLGCLGVLAQVESMLQRPRDAERHAREAVAMAERLGSSREPVVGVAYTALSGLMLARGRLGESDAWRDRAEAVLDALPDPEAHRALRIGTGTLRFAQGRPAEALEWFRRAGDAEAPAPAHAWTWARAWELRARVALGDLAGVRAALAEAGEAAREAADGRNVAARLHLAEGDPGAAAAVLAPAVDGGAPAGYAAAEIESLVLEAVARARLGDEAAGERALERALDSAAPSGQAWVFMTVPEVRPALERHPRASTTHGAFLDELLDHLTGRRHEPHREAAGARLTPREQSVLGLLPTNLTAAEIASELLIGVNTVKTHTRTLYAKLGAHRRGEAVARARERGLLAPSRRP
jgi:LuxR family maltose regulon positive regulatory protein